MTSRALFPTLFYEASVEDADLLEELDGSCRALAQDDRAGRAWSKAHGYRGYTSYASLADLPQRDPAFADLKRVLDRHVAAFARDLQLDLAGRKLKLD
ncbi:TIGR02466 family protein, partial [uncultured Sphingomonas sp.]|uniref:TIGR02466 family protein n=1 Tax=uncultured Sphingomonas sp. TaxID=158754 RepID=UPI0025F08779